MNDDFKALARAIATANHHPDPDAYAEQVAEAFDNAPTPAAPEQPAA